MTFDKKEYNKQYNREKYKSITIRIKPEQKALIDEHTKAKGYTSLTNYILSLIANDMTGENYYKDFIETLKH